jgi:hypothetical protein
VFRVLGNELSGSGVGASVAAEQYGKDLVVLQTIVNELYGDSSKPLVVAPGGFYDQKWFAQLLEASGPNVLNAVTHHIYNLGAGEPFLDIMLALLLEKILFLCLCIQGGTQLCLTSILVR